LGSERRRILLATHSSSKVEELRQLLELPRVQLLSLDDAGITDEPAEDARTFRGNALKKARYYARLAGWPTLADDSGLEVDALDGGPGVRTRRYAGPEATDADNNALLLRELAGLPPERRGARYRCALAFVEPGRPPIVRTGTFRGRIATSPRGRGGFGYDPIFEPWPEPAGGRTVGQLSAAEKHALSHRGKASRAMARALRDRGWS
jgi:XTP/dITP diphosphohydrolase